MCNVRPERKHKLDWLPLSQIAFLSRPFSGLRPVPLEASGHRHALRGGHGHMSPDILGGGISSPFNFRWRDVSRIWYRVGKVSGRCSVRVEQCRNHTRAQDRGSLSRSSEGPGCQAFAPGGVSSSRACRLLPLLSRDFRGGVGHPQLSLTFPKTHPRWASFHVHAGHS